MTTSEQIANLLLKGDEQGRLTREEIDELASDLPPETRALLLKRVQIHGIEVGESRRPSPARRLATPSPSAP